MLDIIPNLKLFLEKIMQLREDQKLVVISDTYATSLEIAKSFFELALSKNIEAVMMVMAPRNNWAHEPPIAIAEALKHTDFLLEVVDKYCIAHTTARKDASEAGAKYYTILTEIGEDYLRKPISLKDFERIKELTNRLADRLTQAKLAEITSPYGTKITMSLEGREGLAIHPFQDAAMSTLPDYAEATISPLEGTSEGIIVVDGSVQGWDYVLGEPIHLTIENGKVIKVKASKEEEERFNNLIVTDENASNCAAEMAIGTSHTISGPLTGKAWDDGRLGTMHIAVGRNDTIGGKIWSNIHTDLLITQPTLFLDGLKIMENGKILL